MKSERANKRSIMARHRKIVAMLNRAHGPIPLRVFADKLEVHYRSVQRDMDYLRDIAGLPIISILGGTRKGFYLTEKLCLCQLCCRPV